MKSSIIITQCDVYLVFPKDNGFEVIDLAYGDIRFMSYNNFHSRFYGQWMGLTDPFFHTPSWNDTIIFHFPSVEIGYLCGTEHERYFHFEWMDDNHKCEVFLPKTYIKSGYIKSVHYSDFEVSSWINGKHLPVEVNKAIDDMYFKEKRITYCTHCKKPIEGYQHFYFAANYCKPCWEKVATKEMKNERYN